MNILPASFFMQPTTRVARALLGQNLCILKAGHVERYCITETEAYDGPHDRASHASRGRTARNAPMFGPPGVWYAYLVYGMYWMLNIVTRERGYPAAVLLRGVEGAAGPGKLTKLLNISRRFNGLPAQRQTGLWLEAGRPFPARAIVCSPRVGVAYAGPEWSQKPWRYCLKNKS